jgi:UDP-N-acetyl-D-mannosaminuronic acid dehydrogenase
VTNDITAEMCKLTENTFRDVNIAYANELSVICDKMGIDVFELIRLANCHPRVNILNPGVGVGGHCIAVDPWFIYEQFPEEAKLIHAARLRNDSKPRFVAEHAIGKLKKITDKVAVLGLSYKPDVDDLRESPSIELCHILKEKGVNFVACEPFAPLGEVQGIPNVSFAEAMQADFVIVTLAHSLFKEHQDEIAQKPHYDCVGMLEQG